MPPWRLCRLTRVTPSFLLHPLDVLGAEDAPELTFFPGMDVPAADKRAIVREVLGTLGEHFTLVPMSAHAAQALAQERLAVLEPARHGTTPRLTTSHSGKRMSSAVRS